MEPQIGSSHMTQKRQGRTWDLIKQSLAGRPEDAEASETSDIRRDLGISFRNAASEDAVRYQPPTSLMQSLTAIPVLFQDVPAAQSTSGIIVYDSWAAKSAESLRDAGPGFVRRLCLAADPVAIELLAERQEVDWRFVARVYENDQVCARFVLQVAGRKLLPRSQGFYHWASRRPPRQVRLLSRSLTVEFGKVRWQ